MAKSKEYFQKAVADGAPIKPPIELHVQQPLEHTVQAGQLFQSDLATMGVNLKLINDTFANLTSVSSKPETTPDMWIHWGSYAVQAILTADYKVMLAVTLLIGGIYAVVNILTDLVHGLLDPRLREQL